MWEDYRLLSTTTSVCCQELETIGEVKAGIKKHAVEQAANELPAKVFLKPFSWYHRENLNIHLLEPPPTHISTSSAFSTR